MSTYPDPEAGAGVFDSLVSMIESGRWELIWPRFAMEGNLASGLSAGQAIRVLERIPADAITADGTLAAFALGLQRMVEQSPSVGLVSSALVALDELRRRPVSASTEVMFFRALAEFSLWRVAGRQENAAAAITAARERIDAMSPQARVRMRPAIEGGLLSAASAYLAVARLSAAEEALQLLGWQRNAARRQRSIELGAFIHAMRGEVCQAAQLIEESEPALISGVLSVPRRIALAAVRLENGNVEQARDELRALEPELADADEWPWAVTVAARLHIVTDPAGGVEEVRRLLHLFGRRPASVRLRRVMESAMADLALAAGEVQHALELTRQCEPEDHALRLTAARIALIRKQRSVVADLRELVLEEDLWPRLRAQAFLLLAVHLHRAGQEESAQTALRHAVAITQGLGIRLIHMLVPRSEIDAIADGADLTVPTNLNAGNPLQEALAEVGLTSRERVLLCRLATDTTLREIADTEFVSPTTVKTQTQNLYRKLGARSRHDAVEIAYRRGILP